MLGIFVEDVPTSKFVSATLSCEYSKYYNRQSTIRILISTISIFVFGHRCGREATEESANLFGKLEKQKPGLLPVYSV